MLMGVDWQKTKEGQWERTLWIGVFKKGKLEEWRCIVSLMPYGPPMKR